MRHPDFELSRLLQFGLVISSKASFIFVAINMPPVAIHEVEVVVVVRGPMLAAAYTIFGQERFHIDSSGFGVGHGSRVGYRLRPPQWK